MRAAGNLLLASDYSGQHPGATHECISVLLTDDRASARWNRERINIRTRFLNDGRRMSFKTLNDRRRAEALDSFLDAANTVRGLLISVVIARKLGSLFVSELGPASVDFSEYAVWRPKVFERLLRVVHLIGLLLAGLSAPQQNVLWITDEDEIAPNRDRLNQVASIFSTVVSHYLPHSLGHCRIGTTNIDMPDRALEDLVAIPDLAAGALSEVLKRYRAGGPFARDDFLLARPDGITMKGRRMMNWFADATQPLKRFVLVIDRKDGTPQLQLTELTFVGSRDRDS
jgi:hypothetical protein